MTLTSIVTLGPEYSQKAPADLIAPKMDQSEVESSSIPDLAIEVRDLSYSFTTSDGRSKPVLYDVNLQVKHGSRVLIIGPNGAGKSTLLRLIAGKHLTADREAIQVLGKPAFFQTLGVSGVSFLGNSMWTRSVAFVGTAVAYEADIAAGDMMSELQTQYKERRDELVKLLDIDLNWRLNAVSDGQRRRIQIMLGLLQPFKVLLIDEFTVDLDVLARKSLLDYLRRETETRGCTILYCTHIFDGMQDWPTQSLFMADGRIRKMLDHPLSQPLYQLCLDFMIEARENQSASKAPPKELLTEEFGVQGFSAGRMFPSTDYFTAKRMNDYKF